MNTTSRVKKVRKLGIQVLKNSVADFYRRRLANPALGRAARARRRIGFYETAIFKSMGFFIKTE